MQSILIRRGSLLFALVLLISSIGISRWMTDQKKTPQQVDKTVSTPVVDVRSIQLSTIRPNIAFSGRILANQALTILSEVNGELLSTQPFFKEGNTFQKGDTLLHIYSKDKNYSLMALKSSFQSNLLRLLATIELGLSK